MIIRKIEPFTEYTKIDKNVFLDKTLSDGAARLYGYLCGLKSGGDFLEKHMMKRLDIQRTTLHRRKKELQERDLINIHQTGPKNYFLYIGNTKLPASEVRKKWEGEEDDMVKIANKYEEKEKARLRVVED